MAKITKVAQNLFGTGGTLSYFGKFGSKAAALPVNTQDPATIQALAAFGTGWEDAVLSGSKPAIEDMNSLFLLAFYQLAYLMQAGVAEWDTTTVYYIGSYANVAGTLYQSLTDTNSGNNPASSATDWKVANERETGIIKDFAGAAANIPSGYLLCDGSAISRTTYSNLFSAIGTVWGVGDGSTTFLLPPAGIVTVGYDSTQTEFNSVGKTGGAKTHQLVKGELPNYIIRTNVFTHETTYTKGDGSGAPFSKPVTLSSGGSDIPHNNLQPYGTVLKIIKY